MIRVNTLVRPALYMNGSRMNECYKPNQDNYILDFLELSGEFMIGNFSCSVNFFARSLLFVGLDVIFLKMVFP